MPFVALIALSIWGVIGFQMDIGKDAQQTHDWLGMGLIVAMIIFAWIAHSISRMADAAEKGAK
jgi:amino acid permease